MKKFLIIAIKDLTLVFRDRPALIFMLLAPFLLTLGLGAVTGRFSDNTTGTGLTDIPVVIVNLDHDRLGDALAAMFDSEQLSALTAPIHMESAMDARLLVDQDKAAAAIIIPEGFTASIIPSQANPAGTSFPTNQGSKTVGLYANPTRPTSAGVIQTIVEQFLARVEIGKIGAETTIAMLIEHGRIPANPADLAMIAATVGTQTATTEFIHVRTTTGGDQPTQFDILAYLAPGMALMFLMFTVSHGGRSILAERRRGTLPRLLVSPTANAQILGGKVLGIFLTGFAQMVILVGATSLLFGLRWGDMTAVAVLIAAAVFGAVGWGMLITSVARTPGQVSAIGSAVMLSFGILGGSFIQLDAMPSAVQLLSKVTPNSWGLDGFITLARGGSFADIQRPLVALAAMGILLFSISAILFNRQGGTK